jgi:uncharacterized MAPEG superfamily protein
MTVAEWMIFAAVLLYLLTLAPIKAIGHAGFDNANPRDPAFYTPGMRSRALGAHLNGIEVFPFFAAAVLLAEFRAAPQRWIDLLAVGFIAIRLAYTGAYFGNLPTVRTFLWNVGFVTNVAIFFMPWWSR